MTTKSGGDEGSAMHRLAVETAEACNKAIDALPKIIVDDETWIEAFTNPIEQALERVRSEAIAECAKVADSTVNGYHGTMEEARIDAYTGYCIADKIRALDQP